MTSVQEPLTETVSPPPCSAEDPQHRAPSKDPNNNFDHSRCEFTFSDGRRCRNQRAQLCAHHASKDHSGSTAWPQVEALCGDLTTATNVNRALARVFLLMAQGRISQKQAVAFGYLSQLLLQTVSGVRAEYVAAFGYHDWETKLKRSLDTKPTQEGPAAETDDVLLSESASRGVRRISPNPAPKQETPPPSSPHHEHEPANSAPAQSPHDQAPFPNYDTIVSRSRDLLAGKYGTTPEGRRQANALEVELELMKPPASKPPKGACARVIEHMKRWIAQKSPIRSGSASRADRVSEGLLSSPASSPANASASPKAPAAPSEPPATRSQIPHSKHVPPSQTPRNNGGTVINSGDSAGRETSSRLRAPGKQPSPRPTPAAPLPEETPEQLGHRVDWYAPVAWSGRPKPEPFPSRKEKLQRKLRMSSCRFRHSQHLNTRGF